MTQPYCRRDMQEPPEDPMCGIVLAFLITGLALGILFALFG